MTRRLPIPVRLTALAAAGLALASAGPSGASTAGPCAEPRPVVRSTEVASAGFKYLPGGPECGTPQLAVVAGSRLTHRNLDFAAHDVRSAALHPGTDDPLFASELTRYLSAGDVHGVAQLPPGRYDFYCTIHPPRTSGSGMRGTLIVQAADR